jgi:hypothetical protein
MGDTYCTFRWRVAEACCGGREASVTSTANGQLPCAVGVPERTPAPSAMPGGRVPEATDQTYGAVPPLELSWTL